MYSREKFENNLDSINEINNEITGEKSVEELIDLVAKREALEKENDILFDKANSEARLINIIFDLDNVNPFNQNPELSLSDYILEYATKAITIKPSSEKEISDLYDKAESIIQKENLQESDFEQFTDILQALKKIVVDFHIETNTEIYTTDTESSLEDNEAFETELVNVDFPMSRLQDGRRKAFKLRVRNYAGVDYYPEVSTYEFRQILNTKRLDQEGVKNIIAACPSKLDVRQARSGRYVLTQESIRLWTDLVSQSQSKLPSIPQESDGSCDLAIPEETTNPEIANVDEFLPAGNIKNFNSNNDESESNRRYYPTVSDPFRIKFLKQLNPIRTIVARFARKDRPFTAFVFKRGDKSIAIIALDRTNNADYVFDADSDEWLDFASQNTKEQILQSNNPIFLGRLQHSGSWQSRFIDYLNETKETVSA